MLTARLYCASSKTAHRRICRLSDPGRLMKCGRLRCWRAEEPGMNKENQDCGALIDRMLEANSEQEVEAVERDAEGWIKEYPDDVRVISAGERLAQKGGKARDPGGRAKRVSLSL